jgi:hypothetical protein
VGQPLLLAVDEHQHGAEVDPGRNPRAGRVHEGAEVVRAAGTGQGVGRAAQQPLLARQRDQVGDQRAAVLQPARQRDGGPRGIGGVMQPVDVVEAPGVRVEQRRPFGGRQQRLAAQHLLVGADGLPVGTRSRGLPGRGGPVPDDGRVVPGLDGVVQHPREVRGRAGEQRGAHPCVELQPRGDRQRLRHRAPRQLVAERDGVRSNLQHPEPLGLGDGPEVRAQRAQQCRFDPGRDHGELLDGLPGGSAQTVHAGQDGVDDRARHRVVRRRERLRDEERVARGGLVQAPRVDGGGGGQLRDGVLGEPIQGQPPHGPTAQSAEDALQGVLSADIVGPVGEQDQRRQVVDPATDVTQQVERGAVGPVHVLDDQHRRARRVGQLLEDGGEHLAGIVRGQRRGQWPSAVPHGVAERAKRPRGQQVVAGAGEHAAGPQRPGEGADQARLPDSRLTRDEHDSTGTLGGPAECGVEGPQLGVPFEEARRHAGIVPGQSPSAAAFAGTAV